MESQTKIMPKALRILADQISAPDDVPSQCLRDAADMIEALEKEALDNLETAARALCFSQKVERDYNGQVAGTVATDSGGTSTGADLLLRLADAGRFRIVAESGRMVVGYWPENDPEKKAP
jgi:uncharacterized protein (UPF0147 family)